MAKSKRRRTGIPLPENRITSSNKGLQEFITSAIKVNNFVIKGNIHGKVINSNINIL